MPDANGCIVWVGCKDRNGYGQVQFNGIQFATHRFAWSNANGPIPKGLQILHKCDNPACVNIEHLFIGTHADNMNDKIRKGRQRGGGNKGEKSHRAKLTTEDVLAIRSSKDSGVNLARRYNVTHIHISCIRNRKCWKHI